MEYNSMESIDDLEVIKEIENLNSIKLKESKKFFIFNSYTLERGKITSLNLIDIKDVPDSIFHLTELQYIYINGSDLTHIPNSIENLKALKILNIIDGKIRYLPYNLSKLKNLEWLDLSYNRIENIEPVCGLSSLKHLNLTGNRIFEVPECIKNLNSLEELILNRNRVRRLPDGIGDLEHLKLLCLFQNL